MVISLSLDLEGRALLSECEPISLGNEGRPAVLVGLYGDALLRGLLGEGEGVLG